MACVEFVTFCNQFKASKNQQNTFLKFWIMAFIEKSEDLCWQY